MTDPASQTGSVDDPLPVTAQTGFPGSGRTPVTDRIHAGQYGLWVSVPGHEHGAAGIDGGLARSRPGSVVTTADPGHVSRCTGRTRRNRLVRTCRRPDRAESERGFAGCPAGEEAAL